MTKRHDEEDEKPGWKENRERLAEFRTLSQAERIISKFGGARDLAKALKAIGRERNFATIYKWTYPRGPNGTGGVIPTAAWPDIMAAARYCGVLITAEDLDPRLKNQKLARLPGIR